MFHSLKRIHPSILIKIHSPLQSTIYICTLPKHIHTFQLKLYDEKWNLVSTSVRSIFQKCKKNVSSRWFEVQCGHSSGNTYWKVHISIAQFIYCIFAHIMRYHSSVSDIFINAFLLVRNVIFKSVLLGQSCQFVYYTKVKFFKRSFVNMSHPHNS